MEATTVSACGANNRAGYPCKRHPALGKTRCHNHGGAAGSGAQPGNDNAFKHGFYSGRLRNLTTDLLDASDQPLDLRAEIALLRTVLAHAADSAEPHTIAQLAGTLARLITAQRRLSLLPKAVNDPFSPDYNPERDTLESLFEEVGRELPEQERAANSFRPLDESGSDPSGDPDAPLPWARSSENFL